MEKLLKASQFMILMSLFAMTDTLGNLAITMVFSGVIYYAGHNFMKLFKKVDDVHEFAISHAEKHKNLEREVVRIDADMKKISTDLKDQITDLNEKLDDFITEIRKDRHSV